MRSVDGAEHWFHVNVRPFRDAGDAATAPSSRPIWSTRKWPRKRRWRKPAGLKAIADERFRRAMENAAVGMCLMNADGRVEKVNHEMCRFLGYDADTLLRMAWDDVTDPDYREENWTNIKAMLKGRADSYRMINQYVHADGHQIWGITR